MKSDPGHGPIVVNCADLDAAIAHYTGPLGYRLDMIMPADAPRVALVSRDGTAVRLEVSTQSDAEGPQPDVAHKLVCSTDGGQGQWVEGRAGMLYRDLIPGRSSGRAIASHIRIPKGGPVPDYVHFHKVGFQMIYCRRGWVRVVYEDQGPAFTMYEGDCVLQPPMIRHRVLEASDGLEVVEVGCPAVHETWRDHTLELPTSQPNPERVFGDQRFVRHIAGETVWSQTGVGGIVFRDTGIFDATAGLASARVLRIDAGSSGNLEDIGGPAGRRCEMFLYVLDGRVRLRGDDSDVHTLVTDDACTTAIDLHWTLETPSPCEILVVTLPARESCLGMKLRAPASAPS